MLKPSHPAAELFPLMEGDDFTGLVEDIRENGLCDPIVLCKGEILDGRNRARACEELGIKPRYTEWSGSSPEAFVISKNIKRRHLTVGQKGMIMAEFATLKKGDVDIQRKSSGGSIEPPCMSAAEVAEISGLSVPTVKRAKLVLQEGTEEEKAAVRSGEAAVGTVAADIRGRNRKGGKVATDIPLSEIGKRVLIMKNQGMFNLEISKKLKVAERTVARTADIMDLLGREDLPAAMRETVEQACALMDESQQTHEAWEIIEPVAVFAWGKNRAGGGTRKQIEASRAETFERVMGTLVQSCRNLDLFEIPLLSAERAGEANRELKECSQKLAAFKTTLEGIYK